MTWMGLVIVMIYVYDIYYVYEMSNWDNRKWTRGGWNVYVDHASDIHCVTMLLFIVVKYVYDISYAFVYTKFS